MGLRTRIPPIFPTTRASNWNLGLDPNLALRRSWTGGGGAAAEREGAYPVPSPRGTLPTWTPSGDDLNLVHNRRSSLVVQARISGILFFWASLLPLRPAFTSFAFSSLPSPTEAWVVLRPHPICHKSQEYIRRGRRRSYLDTAQSKAAQQPTAPARPRDCILPPPLADLVVRDSKLISAPN